MTSPRVHDFGSCMSRHIDCACARPTRQRTVRHLITIRFIRYDFEVESYLRRRCDSGRMQNPRLRRKVVAGLDHLPRSCASRLRSRPSSSAGRSCRASCPCQRRRGGDSTETYLTQRTISLACTRHDRYATHRSRSCGTTYAFRRNRSSQSTRTTRTGPRGRYRTCKAPDSDSRSARRSSRRQLHVSDADRPSSSQGARRGQRTGTRPDAHAMPQPETGDGERGGSGTGISRSASVSATAPPEESASLVLRSSSSSPVMSRGEHRRRLCQHRCCQRCVRLSRRATQSESVTSERRRLASLALSVYVPATCQVSNRDVGY